MEQYHFHLQWNWKTMCGEVGFMPWDNKTKDLGLCFQQLCLQFPIFVLLAAVSSFFFGRPYNSYLRDRTQRRTIIFRCLVVLLLACVPVIKLYEKLKNKQSEVPLVFILISCSECFSWVIHLAACLGLIHKGSSSPRGMLALIILWTMTFVLSVIWLKANFYTQEMTWAIIVIILHCFYALTLIPMGKSQCLRRPEQLVDMERRALLGDYSRFQEESNPLELGRVAENANWLSKLTFSWVHVLISKGVKKKLHNTDDLFDLPNDICCELISDDIEEKLGRGNNLFRALHSLYGYEFYGIGVLRLVADLAGFGGPLLLDGLLGATTDSARSGDAYYYATGLLFSTLLCAFCNAHFNYRIAIVGMRMRCALVCSIYRKILVVHDGALGDGSQALNYMSTDSERIVNSCSSFHAFWSIPFQLLITLYLLYTQLGLAFLGGVAVAIILIPVNRFVMKLIGNYSLGMLESKDKRISATTEVLRGIRSIKFFAWEDLFLSNILDSRDKELLYLSKRKYLDAICVFLWACTPVFISLITFSLYWWFNGSLNARTIFTSVALLAMLIGPLNAFPWVLNGLVEAWVSLKRVQELIQMPELDLGKYYSPIEDQSTAISFKNASFSFYFDQEEKQSSEGVVSVPGLLNILSNSEQREFILHNLNLNIKKGELIGVIGPVGSGKSALLLAILGNLQKCEGKIFVDDYSNGIAYAAQSPWIQRSSIAEAILFCHGLDEQRYQVVLDACELCDGLNDRAGVSENGTTVSGGQRARIALARAAYQDKSVYLLDNILCSLDASIATKIAKNLILGLLKHKTRVIVTSHRRLLLNCDKIIKMSNGKIASFGAPAEVLDDVEVLENIDWCCKESDKIFDNTNLTNKKCEDDVQSMDSILEEESIEYGTLHSNVIWGYWASSGLWLGSTVLLSVIIMQVSRNLSDAWLAHWVSETERYENSTNINDLLRGNSTSETVTYYLQVYAGLAMLNSCLTLARAFLFAYAGIKAAHIMHQKLIKTIIYAKVYFFDVTPLGRILNRFSSDTNTIDDSLPFILNILLAQLAGLLGSLIITLYAMPWLVLLVCPLLPLYHTLQSRYRFCSREIKRLSSKAMSPLYTLFTETIQGIVTIRAMNKSSKFRRNFAICLGDSLKTQINSVAASQWLGLRLQIIGAILTSGAGYLAAIQTQWGAANTALVGLAVSQALALSGLLSGLVNACAETEQELVAAERVLQYSKQRDTIEPFDNYAVNDNGSQIKRPLFLGIETELSSNSEADNSFIEPPYGWPAYGVLQFERVYFKYRSHLPPSLCDISFKVQSGEKLGIVGSTGSGKSSLFAAIFRTSDVSGGRILIDHVDISHISLKTLRSRITIVPQEPFLFAGSIRSNLDPYKERSDSEIWAALRKCSADHLVQSLGGLDAYLSGRSSKNNDNRTSNDVNNRSRSMSISTGERQLLCLVRALLNNSKIVCIDEGTANIDPNTNIIIQHALQSVFHSCTLIVIAHRIGNLKNFDRIIVMKDGHIVELGSPQKLLHDKNSHFNNMMKEETDNSKKLTI